MKNEGNNCASTGTLFGEWLGMPLEVPVVLTYIKKLPGRPLPANWHRVDYHDQTVGYIHFVKVTKIADYDYKFSAPDKLTDDCVIEYRSADGNGGEWCGKQNGYIGNRVNQIFAKMVQTGGFPNYKKKYWKTIN